MRDELTYSEIAEMTAWLRASIATSGETEAASMLLRMFHSEIMRLAMPCIEDGVSDFGRRTMSQLFGPKYDTDSDLHEAAVAMANAKADFDLAVTLIFAKRESEIGRLQDIV